MGRGLTPRDTTDPWVCWLLGRMAALGLTQTVLAQQVGATRQTVFRWTQPGARGSLPTEAKTRLLASLLGVSEATLRERRGAAWIYRGKSLGVHVAQDAVPA